MSSGGKVFYVWLFEEAEGDGPLAKDARTVMGFARNRAVSYERIWAMALDYPADSEEREAWDRLAKHRAEMRERWIRGM